MGLPAQLFLKRACSSRGAFYFVLNSDPDVSHHLDTQSGKVCRDAWKSTFACPSAATAAGRAGLGPLGSRPHFPGQKGSCPSEQHKCARSCPPTPNARPRDGAVARGCRGGFALLGRGRDAAWPPAPQEWPYLYFQWHQGGRCWEAPHGRSSWASGKLRTGSCLLCFRKGSAVPQLRRAPATQPA